MKNKYIRKKNMRTLQLHLKYYVYFKLETSPLSLEEEFINKTIFSIFKLYHIIHLTNLLLRKYCLYFSNCLVST